MSSHQRSERDAVCPNLAWEHSYGFKAHMQPHFGGFVIKSGTHSIGEGVPDSHPSAAGKSTRVQLGP